jgi:hypothetical protein
MNPTKNGDSGAPEGWAVLAPLVALIMVSFVVCEGVQSKTMFAILFLDGLN